MQDKDCLELEVCKTHVDMIDQFLKTDSGNNGGVFHIDVEEKKLVCDITEGSKLKVDKKNFPVYDEDQVYETLRKMELDKFVKNLEQYKEQKYVTTSLEDYHNILIQKPRFKLLKPYKTRERTVRRSPHTLEAEKNYFCYIKTCEKSYTTKKALVLHIRKFHKTSEVHKSTSEILNLAKTNPEAYSESLKLKNAKLGGPFSDEKLRKNQFWTKKKAIKKDNIEPDLVVIDTFEDKPNPSHIMNSEFIKRYYSNYIIKKFGKEKQIPTDQDKLRTTN